ncbi:MAG: type II toxin-antitoxin system death-on-curing family toxin [Anaerolineae bacterium]
MSEPIWLKRVWVDAIHFQQLQRFGGLYGVRGEGAIESALARPRNLAAYDGVADIAALAAAYGYGLTRGHGYVDGNKRVGLVALAIFLDLNGLSLEAPEPEVVQVMLAVASGDLSETDFIRWMQGHIQALEQTPG